MILSRCPGCTTVFRVTAEQLAARQGMVRCGRCGTAFNALDSRAASPRHAPQTAPAEFPAAAALETDLTPAEPAPDSVVPAPPAASPHAEVETRPEPLPAPVPLPSPQPVAGHPAVEIDFPPLVETGPRFVLPDPATDAQRAPEPIRTPAPEPAGGKEPSPRPEPPTQAQPPETAASPPAADASVAEEIAHPQPASRLPVVLAAAVAALTLLAILQGTVVLRHSLAQSFPGLRPTLQALCAPFGCRLELPRRADLVSIETSDLQPDPKHKGQLILGAAIRNRADFALALPHLELTLTDARDRALARRVFAPSDYLGTGANIATGIGAGQELAVHLVIDASSIGASGYRLYVFYP